MTTENSNTQQEIDAKLEDLITEGGQHLIKDEDSTSSSSNDDDDDTSDEEDSINVSKEMLNESDAEEFFGSNGSPSTSPRFHIGISNMAEDRAAVNAFHRIASETGISSKDTSQRTQSKSSFERTQSTSELALGKSKMGMIPGMIRTSSLEKDGGNVSEHSQVFWDLSKAVDLENDPNKSGQHGGKLKISLQTIHQKEELKNDPQTRRFSVEYKRTSSSSAVVTTTSSVLTPPVSAAIMQKPLPPAPPPKPDFLPKTKRTLVSDMAACKQAMKQDIEKLRNECVPVQCSALQELLHIMTNAWATPQYGRDLAYGLCDYFRGEGGLDIVIMNCQAKTYEVMLGSAKVLEQTLTSANRDHLVKHGLEVVLTMSRKNKDDVELSRASCGIIENLFKHTEKTCAKVINLGGLSVVLYSCRSADKITLRHCAVALANLAIYGTAENQQEMIQNKAPEWLFPLAFSEDDSIRYYACLAISVLSANKEIEAEVLQSGTLDLVQPFLQTHSPSEFAYSDRSHIQGRDEQWLKRLLPVLESKRKEAQNLAAFHFAMEAGIKAEQNRKDVFRQIGAVEPLKRVASSPNKVASKLAAEALSIIGEEVPYSLTQQVPLWTVQDVQHWCNQVGFGEFSDVFAKFQVDGDLLLLITEANLKDDIGMTNGITRKRFLRELNNLKRGSDYACCDPTKLNDWINRLGTDLSKYTYQIIRSGVDKQLLPALTEEHLKFDCGIENGIDRMKILQAVRGVRASSLSPMSVDGGAESPLSERPIDVFISYRRSNGSQLASLLKVHLQLRNFTVFLDIERLRAGKFDMNLLTSVRNAKNFVLVLTPGSLDRCVGDDDKRDWVHKEIVAALESACNIIPVMDNFEWPPGESLPEDMKAVSFFNGIRWIHDYQDACVDKLEKFLRGEVNEKQSITHTPGLSKGSSLDLLSPASELHGYGPMFNRQNGPIGGSHDTGLDNSGAGDVIDGLAGRRTSQSHDGIAHSLSQEK